MGSRSRGFTRGNPQSDTRHDSETSWSTNLGIKHYNSYQWILMLGFSIDWVIILYLETMKLLPSSNQWHGVLEHAPLIFPAKHLHISSIFIPSALYLLDDPKKDKSPILRDLHPCIPWLSHSYPFLMEMTPIIPSKRQQGGTLTAVSRLAWSLVTLLDVASTNDTIQETYKKNYGTCSIS